VSEIEAVTLEAATADMGPLLGNLLELYTHDLSDIFSLEVRPDGRFGYDRLPLYWSEPTTRHAFLIRHGGRVAGFVLVTRGSSATEDPPDFDVTEFFVLRAHRHAGVGRQAAFQLWDGMPGNWVVRVAQDNAAGVSFWTEVVAAYTSGMFIEAQRSIDGRDWRVFKFPSGPSSG
jgi:predicted acetyltransferase